MMNEELRMKNFKSIVSILLLCLLSANATMAQDADLQRIAERHRAMKTLNATVRRTCHNTAIADDEVTTGTFSLRKPGQMALTFLDGRDKLLMDGTVYTMVTDGKAQVAQGKTHALFSVLQDVLRAMTGDGDAVSLEGRATLEWTRSDDWLTLAVTPAWEGSKRRMMFRSFIFTIDARDLRLRSLRMNGRGENYTQYDFTDYRPDTPVGADTFKP